MKPKIIILFLIISFLLIVGRYVSSGSLTRNCIYTENRISVPAQFVKAEVAVEKDAYLAIGNDKEYACLQDLGLINHEIINPKSVASHTPEGLSYTYPKREIKPLMKGTTLHIVDMVAVTKHGLSTIDSGAGPISYLILKDKNNMIYKMATVSLGINKDDLFMSVKDPSQPADPSSTKFLSPKDFDIGLK